MNMKGIHGRALDLYNCALEIYRLASLTRKSAYTMNNLAITLAEMGRNDEAFDYFKQAGQIAATIQDASLTLIVDINLADLHLKKGAVAAAKEHCQKAESYLRESGLINGHLVETKKIAGKIALEEGDFETAFNCFNLAIEISRQIGARYLEAEALMARGRLCKALKRNMEALTDLEASYRIYHSLQAEGKRENTEAEINSIENLYLQIFYSMSHEVDRKDPYTKGHSDRVAALGLLLGKQLELPVGTLKTLVAAALLHDIGKIKIDDEVLKKAGKLTPQEFDDIKRHPALGVGLLRGKEFPWDIRPLILHHHEKLDGSGYPLGLKGDDIPTGAKILCIADVFDALTSDRVYRPAYDPETALKMMEAESGSAYDPAFLKCFAAMIRQGLADQVINSHTQDDELFSIWSQCMAEDKPEIPKAKENPAEAHKSPAVAGLSAPANK